MRSHVLVAAMACARVWAQAGHATKRPGAGAPAVLGGYGVKTGKEHEGRIWIHTDSMRRFRGHTVPALPRDRVK